MKKFLFSNILLLSILATFAQSGEIIYRDFEPDLSSSTFQDTLWLDFDCNGEGDICLYMTPHSVGGYMAMIGTSNQWELCSLLGNEADSLPLPSILESWENEYDWFMNQDKEQFAVRKRCDNQYQYGWFRAYWYPTGNPYICHLNLDKFAYCTIPDYPLRWGQTSMTAIEEDTESPALAFIHPNPTTGLVAVTGEGIRHAEAVNVLGQRVATAKGEGNQLTIDLGGLPTGIYFISITDETGRKCVHKVVKE